MRTFSLIIPFAPVTSEGWQSITAVKTMNKYINNTLDEVHDMIQQTECNSQSTTRILNILEKLNNAVKTIAEETLPK